MRYIVTLSIVLLYTHINAQYISDTGALFSGVFYDNSDDKTVFFERGEIRMIPASLTKIVTTATALEVFGPEFQFETEVFYTGKVANGILQGDIIIKACGDPTMGSKYFEETRPINYFVKLYEQLAYFGIKKIDGTIKIESSNPGYSSPRLWEDIGNYYGGFPHGFNWCDNTVEVILSSYDVGEICKIKSIIPDIYPYALQSRVIAASHNKDSAYVYGVPDIKMWWIEGSIPEHRESFKIKAAMPDPDRVFIKSISAYLADHNIEITQNIWVNLEHQNDNKYLLSYKSPKLSEIIKITNQKSNNLFADGLFLALARRVKGMANWDNGAMVLKEFWKDKIQFEQHFRLKDGSGLSPKNLISPSGMVKLLSWMEKHSVNIDIFKSSLAVGGVSGTLKTVLKDPYLRGKVIGKSGSMEGVLGYCGYADLSLGESYCFCVIANNYLIPTKEVRNELDRFITGILIKEKE